MLKFLQENIQIIAVVLSPIVTWFITVKYQERKEKHKSKVDLFLILMAHRQGHPPAQQYIDNLNKIDVVFQNNPKVREAWCVYYDCLHPKSQHAENPVPFQLDLLSEIALALGYRKLKQTEINRFYSPQYFADVANNQKMFYQEQMRVLGNSETFGTPRARPVDEVKD